MTTTTTGRKLRTMVYDLNDGHNGIGGLGISVKMLAQEADEIGAYVNIIPGTLQDEYIIYNHDTDTGKRLTVNNQKPRKYIIVEITPKTVWTYTAKAIFTDDEKIFDEAFKRYEQYWEEDEE